MLFGHDEHIKLFVGNVGEFSIGCNLNQKIFWTSWTSILAMSFRSCHKKLLLSGNVKKNLKKVEVMTSDIKLKVFFVDMSH